MKHLVVTARDHAELGEKLDALADRGWRVVNYAVVARWAYTENSGDRPDPDDAEYSALMVRDA